MRKGQQHTKEYMQQWCKLVFNPVDGVKPALPDVAKFISNLSAKLDGTSGRLFLVLYNSCILFDFWF